MFIGYGNPQKDTFIKKMALFQKVTQEFKVFPFSALADKYIVAKSKILFSSIWWKLMEHLYVSVQKR